MRLLYKASLYMFQTNYEEIAVRIRRTLANAKGYGWTQRSFVLKNARVDRDVFEKVISTLLETGEVEDEVKETATKKALFYRLAVRAKKRR